MNMWGFLRLVLGVGLCLVPLSCEHKHPRKNVHEQQRPVKKAKKGQTLLRGAGATFPAPLYHKWIEEFEKDRATMVVDYEEVGSVEGQDRFLVGSVDFAASDAALSDQQIAKVTRGVQLIPATAGSIVLAYNLEGLSGPLRLKRDVYVDIFLGEIERWNDPRIEDSNPGLKLPDGNIHVVARQDGSGTSFAFSKHLAAVSKEWRKRKGSGTKIDWAPASLAEGNAGVAELIRRTPGAIGYVEFGTAKRTGLKMAWLENKAGRFIRPTGSSGLSTLRHAKLPDNLRAFFPDPDGADSYPIVTFSWLLLYKEYSDPRKAEAVKSFVRWCLTDGQQYNEELGYVRLPPRVADADLKALKKIK
jgi:phosphate transport system substrate-binding protein